MSVEAGSHGAAKGTEPQHQRRRVLRGFGFRSLVVSGVGVSLLLQGCSGPPSQEPVGSQLAQAPAPGHVAGYGTPTPPVGGTPEIPVRIGVDGDMLWRKKTATPTPTPTPSGKDLYGAIVVGASFFGQVYFPNPFDPNHGNPIHINLGGKGHDLSNPVMTCHGKKKARVGNTCIAVSVDSEHMVGPDGKTKNVVLSIFGETPLDVVCRNIMNGFVMRVATNANAVMGGQPGAFVDVGKIAASRNQAVSVEINPSYRGRLKAFCSNNGIQP